MKREIDTEKDKGRKKERECLWVCVCTCEIVSGCVLVCRARACVCT